jgi:hypothetical protein
MKADHVCWKVYSGSKLVIDGKNNDGKDQHDQQSNDNGGVNSILELRILGVEVLKHFTTKVAKLRSDEIVKVDEIVKWKNCEKIWAIGSGVSMKAQ